MEKLLTRVDRASTVIIVHVLSIILWRHRQHLERRHHRRSKEKVLMLQLQLASRRDRQNSNLSDVYDWSNKLAFQNRFPAPASYSFLHIFFFKQHFTIKRLLVDFSRLRTWIVDLRVALKTLNGTRAFIILKSSIWILEWGA